jgi:hypothetical protein
VVAHAPNRLDGRRYDFAVAASFLAILAALGGASRADELQQVAVDVAALAAIGAALWQLDLVAFRKGRAVTIWLGLAYGLLLIQLVPMPPAIWAGLPGHAIYGMVAREVGSSGWRPITLSPDLTLNAVTGLLPATALAMLGLMLDLRNRIRIAQLLVAIACASALLGLVQLAAGGNALHLFRTSSADSAVGLFANRNHQAVMMAIGLPLVAALASIRLGEAESAGKVLASAGAIGALMLIGVAATGSRMGLVLGAVGLVSAASIFFLCSERTAFGVPRRPGGWAAFVAAALLVFVPIALFIQRSGVVGRLTSREAIEQTRLAALGPMLEAASSFMPFGSGMGTFDPVYQRFEPDALLSTIYLNQAHNEPVQLAIEGGLAALALLIVFLLWWLRTAARAVRPQQSAERRAMGIAATSVTLILILSSLVDYPLRTPLLSGVFALFCVELVRSKRTRVPAPVPQSPEAA